MTTDQLLIQYGFKYSRSCNCDGHATKVYTNGNYEFRWRKNRFLGKLKDNGTTLFNWFNIGELENKLSEAAIPTTV